MSGSLCRRFGPGRLPYADRHDIGGGIAMAATGLLAVVLWFGASIVLLHTGALAAVSGQDLVSFGVLAGAFFVPLAIPASLVVGTILWRQIDPETSDPLLGAVLGTCTSMVSMVAGGLSVGLVIALYNLLGGAITAVESIVLAFAFALPAFQFALVFAGWLIVPLGAFGGWYHERSKGSTE
ncbi:hypothetical protein [Halostagnicola sp. A-GB9-2]|uniref:hypothetical protein n=1 Tax=Halostagnicola sp. A-GB9-2 TaxID=3048066 RepID=UPI0024BFD4A8|nr:hypothetical protein [Halostagnicola sp. A-GB9-2]MDJ1430851.1 hypothetical protein [Halostagnicola sp. A-GB9-2]